MRAIILTYNKNQQAYNRSSAADLDRWERHARRYRKWPRCRETYYSWFSSVAIERSEIHVRVADSEEAEGRDGVVGWGEELSGRPIFPLSEIQREFGDIGTASTRKSAKLKMRTKRRGVRRRKR